MEDQLYHPFISKYKDVEPFELDEGVYFHNMATKDTGTKTIVSGLATFEPGAGLPCHVHNVEESVTVIEGEAFCDVKGVRSFVQKFDTSFIPPDVPHRFVNVSSTERLVILWVYSQVNTSLQSVDIERITVKSDRCMLPK
ncbi:cupin domain-containing protein [Salibacterium salarium]|uniref:Cupin domain-containing protein n=1 Tax=Salibacterium salarium TaxID=284579 RepID=A0A428N3W0_9BACI|nr:cupin domain-containing protein [Salibacterium salarium]RSL33130.1 cupin domain-containing protein [Salibacterium salarium]